MLYFYIIPPLVLYAFFFYKFIRKTQYIHYVILTIISIAFGLVEGHNFFNEGFLGLSFFIIIMFTGALSSSRLKRALNQVRAQYAIMGFILISGHAIPYLLYLLDEGMIFTHNTITVGILLYLMFIPLFITSFTFVRKKMKYVQWQGIHNWAYLAYLFMFLHLYLINNSRSMFYLTLFIIYTVFRIVQFADKYITKQKRIKKSTSN